jgi:hypothetical protein
MSAKGATKRGSNSRAGVRRRQLSFK